MIEAPSAADVTFSRTGGSRGEALSAALHHSRKWRLALEHRTQADLTPTITTAAPSSSSAQPNKLGQYHCWNRELDLHTGRWTTPDPAMNHWSNLFDYAKLLPLSNVDSTGLDILPPQPPVMGQPGWEEWYERNMFSRNKGENAAPQPPCANVRSIKMDTDTSSEELAEFEKDLDCCPCSGWKVQGKDVFTTALDLIHREINYPISDEEAQAMFDQDSADALDPFTTMSIQVWAWRNVPTAALTRIVDMYYDAPPRCKPGCKRSVTLLSWDTKWSAEVGTPEVRFTTAPDPRYGGDAPPEFLAGWDIILPIKWKIYYEVLIECRS